MYCLSGWLKELFMEKERKTSQLIWGLGFGIVFGFLLQKGGLTKYDVIVGQLLLTDFTMVKVMLSAILTGMIGIYFMNSRGWLELQPKSGSYAKNMIGGLIFGIGFAILGYCPGTIAGAIGNGSLDALFGGLVGVLIGSGVFAAFYPLLNEKILNKGNFGSITLPQLFKVNPWLIIIPLALVILLFFFWLETAG
jgi:hypothetical protein